MNESAWIFSSAGTSDVSVRLSRLLHFFGIEAKSGTPSDFITTGLATPGQHRILGTADDFLVLLQQLRETPEGTQIWKQRVHSGFIHLSGKGESLEEFFRLLAPGTGVRVARPSTGGKWRVSDQMGELCAPVNGLCFSPGATEPEWAVVGGADDPRISRIIAADDEVVFLQIFHEGIPLFIVTSATVIDVEAQIGERGFDIRDSWATALPAVMYLRWAFRESAWKPKGHSACLIIDDPLLKPKYGFLNYQNLLEAMRQHRFSTSIAFIPWNWRRSRQSAVRLFREHPKELSISVHGCDHTAGEFGNTDVAQLHRRLQLATERMDEHAASTGLQHDRVMVFPQGVFSTSAMAALKRSDFVGAVNTEVMSVDPPKHPLRVADVWDAAIMSYDGFPIFTRRYPWQEVVNFAFDVLLGKPCLVVIHHDFCRDENAHLIEFIDRLNAQLPSLNWRGLGDVLQNSYRWRQVSEQCVEIEMFAGELLAENRSSARLHYRLRRRNGDPSAVREVVAGNGSIPWTHADDYLNFEVTLEPGEQRLVRVAFHAGPKPERRAMGVKYRVKTALRRYLSELRDYYVTTMKPARIPGQKSNGTTGK